jgi:molybdopterin biosynthesis enzyme
MVRADGLAVLPADAEKVEAGTRVRVQLLNSGDLSAEPGF